MAEKNNMILFLLFQHRFSKLRYADLVRSNRQYTLCAALRIGYFPADAVASVTDMATVGFFENAVCNTILGTFTCAQFICWTARKTIMQLTGKVKSK